MRGGPGASGSCEAAQRCCRCPASGCDNRGLAGTVSRVTHSNSYDDLRTWANRPVIPAWRAGERLHVDDCDRVEGPVEAHTASVADWKRHGCLRCQPGWIRSAWHAVVVLNAARDTHTGVPTCLEDAWAAHKVRWVAAQTAGFDDWGHGDRLDTIATTDLAWAHSVLDEPDAARNAALRLAAARGAVTVQPGGAAEADGVILHAVRAGWRRTVAGCGAPAEGRKVALGKLDRFSPSSEDRTDYHRLVEQCCSLWAVEYTRLVEQPAWHLGWCDDWDVRSSQSSVGNAQREVLGPWPHAMAANGENVGLVACVPAAVAHHLAAATAPYQCFAHIATGCDGPYSTSTLDLVAQLRYDQAHPARESDTQFMLNAAAAAAALGNPLAAGAA